MPAFLIASNLLLIEINAIVSTNQPRENMNISTVAYSLNGAILRRSPLYRRFMWNFTALVDWQQFEALTEIWDLQESGEIEFFSLHDYTAPLIKEATRTRLLAQGTSEVISDGLSRYNGQFHVVMPLEPKRDGSGGVGSVEKFQVPLQLFEYKLSL